MRFGLCCLFKNQPVSFRTTTAKALTTLPRHLQLQKLSEIALSNSENLLLALQTCQKLHIGAFRIMSPLFPGMTHPQVGYSLDDLPFGDTIKQNMEKIKLFGQKNDIRLSFHPDQFVVLSSPTPEVVSNSITELVYQGELAEMVGADVINIHGGGVYGDKKSALERFCGVFPDLPENVRVRLTIENDDISYSVTDLLPICEKLSIPLVYDVHHHRCNPDELSIESATAFAKESWQNVGGEQYCHLSSPKDGWGSKNPKPHADYIDISDFPECWEGVDMTVDIEAKGKELAVVQLMQQLQA